jgi:hypothetical protein
MERLADVKNRILAGVNPNNKFVLASGFCDMAEMCKKANVSLDITATKIRYSLCTFFGRMGVDQHIQDIFCRHMGHNITMQKSRYRCPPAIETLNIGKFLLDKDRSTGT